LDALYFENVEGKVFVNDTLNFQNTTTVSDDILSSSFVSALLHEVELKNGSFRWYSTTSDTVQELSFENFNLYVEELYSDSTIMKKARGVELADMNFSFENFQNKLVKNYTMGSEKVTFNSKENRYSIINPHMIPTQEKMDSQNYLKLHISQVDLVGINYDSLIRKDLILVDKVYIKEPNFTYVRPPQKLQKDTIRELPAVTLKKIPIPLSMDMVNPW
jgi:hypothetical protein